MIGKWFWLETWQEVISWPSNNSMFIKINWDVIKTRKICPRDRKEPYVLRSRFGLLNLTIIWSLNARHPGYFFPVALLNQEVFKLSKLLIPSYAKWDGHSSLNHISVAREQQTVWKLNSWKIKTVRVKLDLKLSFPKKISRSYVHKPITNIKTGRHN